MNEKITGFKRMNITNEANNEIDYQIKNLIRQTALESIIDLLGNDYDKCDIINVLLHETRDNLEKMVIDLKK